jgi:excinuclease ABC subunit A
VNKTADRIIDLGPEAWPGLDSGTSDGGGEIVAAGPPEEIAREKRSYTRAVLKPVLAQRGAGEEAA